MGLFSRRRQTPEDYDAGALRPETAEDAAAHRPEAEAADGAVTPLPEAGPPPVLPGTEHAPAPVQSRLDPAPAPMPPRAIWSDGLGRTATRSAQLLLTLLLAVVVIYGLLQLRLLVIPVLIALILAAAVGPVVRLLRGWGWSAALATATAFLGILVVLGGVITGIVFAVRNESDELVSSAREGWMQLQEFLANFPLPVSQQQIDEALAGVVDFLTSATVGRSALSGLSTAAEVVTGAVLMAVILFFFLKDGPRIWRFLLSWFPAAKRPQLELAGSRAMDVLGSYVRGTATVAAVDAFFIGLALFILQVPLALPLSVLIFIGGFIPIVGATIAGVLATLVALVANGPVAALVVVAVVIIVQQLEGNFLQPVVMGRSVSLHSLVILLALTAGTILGGIVGAVLAVPVTAVGWVVIQVMSGRTSAEEPAPVRRGR